MRKRIGKILEMTDLPILKYAYRRSGGFTIKYSSPFLNLSYQILLL